MGEDEDRVEIEVVGHLDVSDEHCSDGSAALSIVLDNGDEYTVRNRKVVKRLMKYAYDQVEMTFKGYLSHDPTGIDVFSVTSVVPPVREKRNTANVPYEEDEEKRHRGKRHKGHNSRSDASEDEERPDIRSIEELEDEVDNLTDDSRR